MKFTVITLFPELIQTYAETSILGRAQAAGRIQVEAINPRDFTEDAYKKVDDAPYGGGPGMVMMCKPLLQAYRSLAPMPKNTKVLITSPWGKPFTQQTAKTLCEAEHIVIISGHYEGIDARILDLIPEAAPISLGDFILTGGELPALAIIDATARLLPGVIGKEDSLTEESFTENLLEYPHYTRPEVFEGHKVPEVLLSGNHKEIAHWRKEMSKKITQRHRPDLL